MNKSGPIVIIEDDIDDHEIFTSIFKDLNIENEIVFFSDGWSALESLTTTGTVPFIIMSDIDLPQLNGLELREKIINNEDLRMKSIPYLFFTTKTEQTYVIGDYSGSIQGFFIKPPIYQHLRSMMKRIIEYWRDCEAPKYISNAQ